MASEFKAFALRGNVVDLAVAVVIGGAFGKIVSSFVADIIMPLLGLLLGTLNFSKLALTLRAATADHPALALTYGNFIQASIDFLLIAIALFIVVKAINSLQRKQAPPPPQPSTEEKLLTEIRDLLKQPR
ncbi:MAG: large-conductance mechanosensitive channel protein MscL [Gammaproteobacteria bacterium]|nr:large-conductance mechanosensitive channel protein MscL [Gammaproteobacteria bacterium]